MINSVFGETTFNMGWETSRKISLFGRDFSIIISAAAYSETDRITPKQEEAYSHYLSGEGRSFWKLSPCLRIMQVVLLRQKKGIGLACFRSSKMVHMQ